MFLADGAAIRDDIRYRPTSNLEPTIVLAAIARQTRHTGLIGTLSSSFNEPYDIARRLATLDQLSGGRAGWNVVTTADAESAGTSGCGSRSSTRLRYEMAAEFVEVVRALWNSWEPDALVGDRTAGVFADAGGSTRSTTAARTSTSPGRCQVPRSPQGEPVIVQAGASPDGRDLAARVGEVVFSAAQTLEAGQEYYGDIKTRAAGYGRRPEHVVVLPGLCTVIGSTEAEARERRERLDELVHPSYALGRLAGQLGVPAQALELDAQLPYDLLPEPARAGGSQTFYAIVLDLTRRERLTVRQLLRHLGGGVGHRIVVGTPEQIADTMIEWVDNGAADGFNVMPDVLPEGFDVFAEHVIGELARRGRFRTEYAGTTLRENLGIPEPPRGGEPGVDAEATGARPQAGVDGRLTMARDLHLLVNVTGTGYHPAAWREDGQPADAFVDVRYFESIATLAERGLFDGILLPDIPFQSPRVADAPTQALEPTLLLAALAAGTRHIGLIPTVSSSYNAPYNLARRILSLDHASGGRAAWNIVTSVRAGGGRRTTAQSAPADRAARYRRAAEFVEVAIALWDSWDDDALAADQDSGEFADADRIHEIGHAGEFFDVAGPMNVPRSPQGRPVIAQAGASEPGIEFAAAYAEVVYGSQLSLEGAIEFSSRIRSLAAQRGRDRDSLRILPGLVAIAGADEAQAWARWRRLNGHLDDGRSERERLEAALWLEPGSLGDDLDAPIDPELFLTEAPRPQGFGRALSRFAAETGSSPRQLADRQLGGHRAVIGSPAQIADHIETSAPGRRRGRLHDRAAGVAARPAALRGARRPRVAAPRDLPRPLSRPHAARQPRPAGARELAGGGVTCRAS